MECGRVTFSNLVAVWSARWWRFEGVTAPFSLAGDEKQGLEMSVGIADASLRRAGLRSREGVWCSCVVMRGRNGSCLAREKKRQWRRFGELGSRRRCFRWRLASTAVCLAGRGTCGSGACCWNFGGSGEERIGCRW